MKFLEAVKSFLLEELSRNPLYALGAFFVVMAMILGVERWFRR